MHNYEKLCDRLIFVPSGRKGVKDRQVMLKHLHTDGSCKEYMLIMNAMLKQKADLLSGTIIIFPDGIKPSFQDIETFHFDICEYSHNNFVSFSNNSTAIFLPESELEYALMPLTEKVYKGYALILNLYKHRGRKCKRLYMAYF
ncbi:hypothetical protein SAMN02910353_02550 [Ruminococcus sp. YRD2003]|uniref:hypothetical protein n=1 Tax=Ruminococcus sp. YRD2003 TaxID=1452313 RepID=UPI0008D1F8C9|nr:hypothetical protein SAMN02910353_02550 [Ruminococcus flavefaciens]